MSKSFLLLSSTALLSFVLFLATVLFVIPRKVLKTGILSIEMGQEHFGNENFENSKARIFRRILSMRIPSIYTLGYKIVTMMASSLNRGDVAFP